MRYTLEQLKAMDDKELYGVWGSGTFPFEYVSGCERCLTQHHELSFGKGVCKSHAELSKRIPVYARSLADGGSVAEFCAAVRSHLEELYALRLFYDSLYPQPVEQTQTREAELERVALTHWDSRAGTQEVPVSTGEGE